MFKGLGAYSCDQSDTCLLCDSVTSDVYIGQWVSLGCDETVSTVLAKYVKIEKIFTTESFSDFYIGDIEIFGR